MEQEMDEQPVKVAELVADLKEHYMPYFTEYVQLIHKHSRLIVVDVAPILEKESAKLDVLEGDHNASTFSSVFQGMLKTIEHNNALSEAADMQTVDERIGWSFQMLRILDKVPSQHEYNAMRHEARSTKRREGNVK